MSLFPILWALKSAPVADAAERLILIAMAEAALADGTGAALPRKEIAAFALVDLKTVQRRLSKMTERGLIAEGDQDVTEQSPEWGRPRVYDLLIPHSAFPDIEQVNAERAQRGKAPLTPQTRPNLPDAPPRARRADFGKVLGPQRQRTGISEALRQFVYERDGYQCVRCGSTEDLTLDHIQPWVLGGANSVDNLRTLCRPCNSSKNAKVEGAGVDS